MSGRRAILAVAFGILAAMHAWAAEQHTVQGILLQMDQAKRTIKVSCLAVPGYMEAMVMTFPVRESGVLEKIAPGTTVRFTLVEQGQDEYAEHLHAVKVVNYEAEPTEADRLTFMHRALDPAAAGRVVPVGQMVPDFSLTDQAHEVTHLAQFRGKVVALTFAYSRCPNPNYCFRLSNNLAQLSRRFHERTGRDLVLITVVIDPDQDRGKALDRFADTWKADAAIWHFLTGPLGDVRKVAELFGMNFWADEGFLTHSFHTVVIDREGDLAANLEGNEFTAEQLGDLVETVLRRPIGARDAATTKGTGSATTPDGNRRP